LVSTTFLSLSFLVPLYLNKYSLWFYKQKKLSRFIELSMYLSCLWSRYMLYSMNLESFFFAYIQNRGSILFDPIALPLSILFNFFNLILIYYERYYFDIPL
jgi:hypothetical protein